MADPLNELLLTADWIF